MHCIIYQQGGIWEQIHVIVMDAGPLEAPWRGGGKI